MATEPEELIGKNYWKIRFIDLLKFVTITAHMVGDFFREIGALTFIFVPLELWKGTGDQTDIFAWHVSLVEAALIATFIFLAIGFLFEYLSVGANRIKKDLEVNSGYK